MGDKCTERCNFETEKLIQKYLERYSAKELKTMKEKEIKRLNRNKTLCENMWLVKGSRMEANVLGQVIDWFKNIN